jgi:hypothetical protein
MNIALEGTREFVDGKMRRSYGDAFVRGNNGMFCLFPNALCISRAILLPQGFSSLRYYSLVWREKSYIVWKWLADVLSDIQ